MGAKAAQAQRPPSECVSDANNKPGAYGVFGLLIAYIVALAFGIVANLPVEKLEAIMNVAAIAGLAILWAVFWNSSRWNVAEHPRRDLRRHTASTTGDLRMTTNKAGSLSTDRWGPGSIIGSLNE